MRPVSLIKRMPSGMPPNPFGEVVCWKLKMDYVWNPHFMSVNPFDAPLVESYLVSVSEEQKKGESR